MEEREEKKEEEEEGRTFLKKSNNPNLTGGEFYCQKECRFLLALKVIVSMPKV